MIVRIHVDFTDGTELSYVESKRATSDFTTCCLDFFNIKKEYEDVILVRSDGETLSRNELIDSSTPCGREIREAHNLHKMLVAGVLGFLEI